MIRSVAGVVSNVIRTVVDTVVAIALRVVPIAVVSYIMYGALYQARVSMLSVSMEQVNVLAGCAQVVQAGGDYNDCIMSSYTAPDITPVPHVPILPSPITVAGYLVAWIILVFAVFYGMSYILKKIDERKERHERQHWQYTGSVLGNKADKRHWW